MKGYLIGVTLGSATGIPKDAVVNTFAVRATVPLSDGDLTTVMYKFIDFYNNVPSGQAASIAQSLSNGLLRTPDGCKMTGTVISDGGAHGVTKGDPSTYLGSPQVEFPWTLGVRGIGEATLPEEVALKLTFEASGRAAAPVEGPGGTRPRGRLTGGVYLGPFTTAVCTSETAARPPQALIDRINGAGRDLMAALDGAIAPGTLALGVWSRSDGVVHPCNAVSVDNAWDTIRGRGLAPTVRTRVTYP